LTVTIDDRRCDWSVSERNEAILIAQAEREAGAPKPASVELGGWSTTIATCDEVAQEPREARVPKRACVEQASWNY